MHYLQDIKQLIEPIPSISKQEPAKDPWPEPEGWPAPYEDAKWDDAWEKYKERITQANVCDYPEDIKWLVEEEPDWSEDGRWDTAERPKTYPGQGRNLFRYEISSIKVHEEGETLPEPDIEEVL